MRMGGQVRAVSSMAGVVIIGWDMNAAFRLADGLGIPPEAVAEFVPEIEQIACAKTNERMTENG